MRAETLFTEMPVGLKPVVEALGASVSKKHESCDYYVTGESSAHACAKLLCVSSYKERYPEYDFPKLEIWMRFLFASGWQTGGVESNSEKLTSEDYPRWMALERTIAMDLSLTLPCILETSEGYVGFGPVATQAGQLIFHNEVFRNSAV